MNYLFYAIIPGILSVDRNSALNLMLSRPIVISTIIGLTFGHYFLCFLSGILFEIIGLMDIPVGTHVPKDDTFAAYVSSLMIAFGYVKMPGEYLLLALIVLFLIEPVTYTDIILRKINKNIFNFFNSKSIDIKWCIYSGIFLAFARGLVFYNLGFFIIKIVFYLLKNFININGDLEKFIFINLLLLTGYFIRFINVTSFSKYLIFVCGLLVGWLFV